MLVGLPPNVTFEAAATLPTVFITADTAFQHATTLQPGDRVLVHAAAGQVLSTNCCLKCMMCFLEPQQGHLLLCLIFMRAQNDRKYAAA